VRAGKTNGGIRKDMRIRNRSGVDLALPLGRGTMRPGEAADVRVAGLEAILRQGMADGRIEICAPSEGTNTLWKDKDGLHLLWLSPLSLSNGYGIAAEALAKSLVGQGVNIYAYPSWFEWHAKDPMFRAEVDVMLRKSTEEPLQMGIAFVQPGHFRILPTPYRIGYTMYESDNPLETHPEWRHECKLIDRLWVPSAYCQEVFSRFADVPINVVPLPVHPDYCCAEKRRKRMGDIFTFGMHGYLTSRKSPEETVKTFLRVFPRKEYPNVRLELKTWLGVCGYGKGQLPRIDDERVTIFDESWSREEIVAWLLSLDAFVFPSKGEGFGLPPREALASGVPVIVADNTGLTDVAANTYTYPVPCGQPEPSPLGGNWSVPLWDALGERMREVYENHDKALRKAKKGAVWVANHFSYAAVGRIAFDILDDINPTHPPHLDRAGNTAPVEEGFVNFVRERVPGGSKVLVLGRSDLSERLKGLYQIEVVEDPYKLPEMVWGGRRYTACLSWGWFQRLYDGEMNKFAVYQLRLSPIVIAGVPSVRSDIFWSQDSRYLRPKVWQDLMPHYVVDVYPLEQMDIVTVMQRDDVPHGIVYRR
jgi:glycosyltransferase involved in cell wall biosynthesis